MISFSIRGLHIASTKLDFDIVKTKMDSQLQIENPSEFQTDSLMTIKTTIPLKVSQCDEYKF